MRTATGPMASHSLSRMAWGAAPGSAKMASARRCAASLTATAYWLRSSPTTCPPQASTTPLECIGSRMEQEMQGGQSWTCHAEVTMVAHVVRFAAAKGAGTREQRLSCLDLQEEPLHHV